MTRSIAGTVYFDVRRAPSRSRASMSMARAPSLVPSAEVAGRAGGGRAEHERHRLGLEVATFALGREQKSGEAIALLGVDESIAPAALAELPRIRQVKALRF
jgi:D-3-phosphoglycerate dehydrogenase